VFSQQLWRVRNPSVSCVKPEELESNGIEIRFSGKKMSEALMRKGLTVLLTGLPGSGKTTIALLLKRKLEERDHRRVTLLDGEWFRSTLSRDVGSCSAFRGHNLLRLAQVAMEVARLGGVAICTAVARQDAGRRRMAELVSAHGNFVLVYLSTSLAVCEKRDPKGLYAMARSNTIASLTGVTDPYEEPETADLVIDTSQRSAVESLNRVLTRLSELGLISPVGSAPTC